MVTKSKAQMVFLGGFALFMGALYAVAGQPYMNSDEWRRIQKTTRKGIDQESIQPGDMKVWSDPFAPKEKPK